MGYHFHFRVYGNPNLPIVLFLHGFLGSHQDFDQVITRLGDSFCCLAVDLPGHGYTQVEGDEAQYTMPQTAIALVHWLDQLQIARSHLVGYSMGGRLALYLALRFPQRFPRVVLESASPGLPTEQARLERRQRDAGLAEQLQADFPAFLTRWYEQPLFQSLRQHPSFEQMWERRSRNRPEELAKSLRYLGTGQQPSLWQPLSQHTQPLLLLVGEYDSKFQSINQAMITCCPAAQLKVIPGCGHVIHAENPDLFAEQVRSFLGDPKV